MPLAKYSAKEVMNILLEALQSNDDPQLDNGAAVVLMFATSDGTLNESGLSPSQYGKFLREQYPTLIGKCRDRDEMEDLLTTI